MLFPFGKTTFVCAVAVPMHMTIPIIKNNFFILYFIYGFVQYCRFRNIPSARAGKRCPSIFRGPLLERLRSVNIRDFPRIRRENSGLCSTATEVAGEESGTGKH